MKNEEMPYDPHGVATVTVEGENGPMLINKSDYDADPDRWSLIDADQHKPKVDTEPLSDDDLSDAERERAAKLGINVMPNWKPSTVRRKIKEAEAITGGNAQRGVTYGVREENGRYLVYDRATGAVHFDQAGYDTEADAWTATIG